MPKTASKTEAPKKRTRKPAEEPKKRRKEIDPAKECSMCHNGEFKAGKSNYSFSYRGKPHVIMDVPCVICDSCGGKKYASEDIIRPSLWMKSNGRELVTYKDVMKVYWDWNRSQKGQK